MSRTSESPAAGFRRGYCVLLDRGTCRARRYSAPHLWCLILPAVLRRARAERTVVGGLLICSANARSFIGLFPKALMITSSVVTKTGAAPGKA